MHSSSRNKAKVRVLAVHTTEGIMRAADLRDWASWPGSSHASADETGVLLAGAKDGFVDYDLAAWTLRNGNPWSENIELCGWAKWKRDEWLSRPKLLDACARWLAERAVARGIPLVKLSPKEYAAGRSGVIGHVDHTVGYSDGTHTDPGPNFPYDVVLPKAAAYAGGQTPTSEEDDMFSDADREVLNYLKGIISWGFDPTLGTGPAFGQPGQITNTLAALRYLLDPAGGEAEGEVLLRLRSIQGLVSDPAAFAAALAPHLGGDVDQATVEAGVRAVLGGLDAA